MFFENETTSFTILDVVKLNQKNVNMYNTGRNFCALSYRIRANTVLKTDNGKYYNATDNSVSFIPSGLNYERISDTDEMIVIHFSIKNCGIRDIEIFKPSKPDVMRSFFEDILDCWNKKDIGYRYKCSAAFNEILAICCLENFRPENTYSKIQKSVDFLLNHFKDSNLSVKEIAAQSFISEVYFRKLFKAEYRISPQKYIIHLRIQNAVNLILMGYYSLGEVALMSGYTDYKYFSATFKKLLGVSPSKYFYNYYNCAAPDAEKPSEN